MTFEFSVDDIAYLTSDDARAALAAVDTLPLTSSSIIKDTATARTVASAHAPSVIETVRLRRRAMSKLTNPMNLLLTGDALEQSTASVVARHRARRLRGRFVHDVTCSVGGEVRELAAEGVNVVGSDLDRVRLYMAEHNVPGVGFFIADATVPTSSADVIIADPARRSGGERKFRLNDLLPGLPELFAAYRGRDVVIKCAPGLDYSYIEDSLGFDGEVEVVSLDGGVREAVLWSRGASGGNIRRRATILTSDGSADSVTDADADDLSVDKPGRYIIDPDGAVVRAGLVRHWAHRERLWQLDPRIAYLTGNRIPDGYRGFEIVSQLKFNEKAVKAELKTLDCGSLEILTRGVNEDPDRLRRRLKCAGTMPYSLILTRIGTTPTAFITTATARRRPVKS